MRERDRECVCLRVHMCASLHTCVLEYHEDQLITLLLQSDGAVSNALLPGWGIVVAGEEREETLVITESTEIARCGKQNIIITNETDSYMFRFPSIHGNDHSLFFTFFPPSSCSTSCSHHSENLIFTNSVPKICETLCKKFSKCI